MLGPLHTYVLPAVRQRAPLPPLPAKAPRAIRAYQVDGRQVVADAGTTLGHPVLVPGGGMVVGNIDWTADGVVTFLLGGGAAGGPDPALALALLMADGQREDYALVQPIRSTLPDIPDDALSVDGQLMTLAAAALELTTLGLLPGGAQAGDMVLTRRGTAVGLLPVGSSSGTAPATTPYTSFTAAATISGHRVLMVAAGGVAHASPAAPFAFAGISTQAAAQGDTVLVAEDGQTVTEPSWSWTPGDPLFVGSLGVLTAVPPTSGISQQVAVAVATSAVLVQPFAPIRLS